MPTYHHFSSLNQHRSESDEASATPVISSGLRRVGPLCNQLAQSAARLAAFTRFIASIYFDLPSLNKGVLLTPSKSDGANGRTRTVDLLFTKQLLCRLSYVGSPLQFTMIRVGLPHDFLEGNCWHAPLPNLPHEGKRLCPHPNPLPRGEGILLRGSGAWRRWVQARGRQR